MKKLILRLSEDKKLQLLVISLATIVAYSNIFQNSFVIDDAAFIINWEKGRSLENTVEFFKGEVPLGHEGVYRPLKSIFFAAYRSLFETNLLGWHLNSLAVHLLATFLIYLIIDYALKSRLSAFVSSLIFGVHPIHTETITYISSSMDALGIVFFFVAFYLYLRKKLLFSAIFAALAFFTNELTLTLPILILLYDFCFNRSTFKKIKRLYKFYLPYFVLATFYLFIRFVLLNITSRGGYLADSVYLTALAMLKVFLKYLELLVWPINQANNHVISKGVEAFVYRDYRIDAIMVQSPFDGDILLPIFVLSVVIFIAVKAFRKYPVVTFSTFWFFISLLPVSEIVPQGAILNERMLYIPSFGLILILGYLASKVKVRRTRLVLFMTLILVALFGYLTYQRNKDWKDEITLWSKDIKVYPNDNAYAYYQLGNAHSKKEEYEKAISNYSKSNQINSKFVLGLGQIAVIYHNLGMNNLAVQFYKEAIDKNPTFWEGRFNLGNLYLKEGRLDLAEKEYLAVLAINPNFLPAKINLKKVKEGIK